MSRGTRWVAVGGGLSFVMQGAELLARGEAGDAQIVRVGDGVPAALPAPVLPDGGRALPGFTQASPADVISGWVRIWIAGFLAERPNWDGVICALHGDVTHWVHISADEAVSSQSFVTLRLIAALSGAERADMEALSDSLSRPERLAAHLRVAEVTGQPEAITGHLIGAELAAARAYWLGQQVVVIGEGALGGTYTNALAAQGCPVSCQTVNDVLPAGLKALGQALGLAD